MKIGLLVPADNDKDRTCLTMKNELSIAVATQEILSANSEGVELINSGDFARAVSVFSRCTLMVKRIIRLSDDSNTSSTSACAFFKILHVDSISSRQQFFMGGNLTSRPQVSNRPLSILGPINILKLAYTQIYNLALSVHLSAVSPSDDGSHKNEDLLNKQLHRALKLYESAMKMDASGDIQLSLVEKMALVNNLGHVHHALKNDVYSQGCFQNLVHLLKLFQETSSEKHQMSLYEQKLYEGFLENALSFFLSARDLPAAAA
jgi:hypothetical protein